MRRRRILQLATVGGSLFAGCSTLDATDRSPPATKTPTNPRITLRQESFDETKRIIAGGLPNDTKRYAATLVTESADVSRFDTAYISQYSGGNEFNRFVTATDFDAEGLFVFQALLPGTAYSLSLTELRNANGTVNAKLTERAGNGGGAELIETLLVRFEKSNYPAANFYVHVTTAEGRVKIIDSE